MSDDGATGTRERRATTAGPEDRGRRPVPRGWGSHDERRTMRLALAAFVLLGLYATAFVLLGQLLSA